MCQASVDARRMAAFTLSTALWLALASVATAQDAPAEAEPPADAGEEAEAPAEQSPAEPADDEPGDAGSAEDAGEAPAEPGETSPAEGDVGASGAGEFEGMTDEEILAAFEERPQLETGTGITGRVVDAETGEGIIEGAVVVVGAGRRVYTNLDGHFAIDVPPGTYTLRSFYELYQPTRVSDVEVVRGEATDITIELSPDTESVVEELVVTARADTGTAATQLQMRRQATQVQDSISAEEISRSPDSAASDAARRVVAATVVGGRYLYVRGLGGRYTNVLLNGATLPSLDPDVVGVQLDMFPANILSSLSILKTYSPDLPGSFAGGTMLLQTRDFPNRFEVGASLSLGMQTGGTFNDQTLDYEGGGLDFLGIDDGTRALPDSLEDRALRPSDDLSRDQADDLARDFPNRWQLTREMALPDLKLGFNVGDTLTIGDRFLGYLLAFGYSRGTDYYDDEVINRIGNVAEARDPASRQSTSTSVLWSVLGSATLELADGHELSFTSLANQSASDYVAYRLTDDQNEGLTASRTMRFVQRFLWFNQLAGEHRDVFGGARLQWQVNSSLADREEPDTREVAYTESDGGFSWSPRDPGDGQRLYSHLDQFDVGGGANLEIPLLGGSARLGGSFNTSDRTYTIRRFQYRLNRRLRDLSLLERPPQELFAPENAGVAYDLRELTTSTDGYEAQQELVAAFAMADLPVTDWFRVIGGARAESFRQVLEPRSPFAAEGDQADEDLTVYRTDVDVLPSLSLVFQMTEDMYLRAAYSETVARPHIRELLETTYPDFVRDRVFFGDADLQRTLIRNVDVRWELFPGETEVLAASVFAKFFEDPIELVILNQNYTVSYRNIDSARNLGAEVEARLSFGRIQKSLEAFSIGGNLTVVDSQAVLTAEQAEIAASEERPLAGQSPYVANLSLGFAPIDSGLQAFLYYNVFGRRIDEVAVEPLTADTYEQPFHSLDLIVAWDIDEHFSLKGSIKNILFDDVEFLQGDVVRRRYNPGMSASVKLGWSN